MCSCARWRCLFSLCAWPCFNLRHETRCDTRKNKKHVVPRRKAEELPAACKRKPGPDFQCCCVEFCSVGQCPHLRPRILRSRPLSRRQRTRLGLRFDACSRVCAEPQVTAAVVRGMEEGRGGHEDFPSRRQGKWPLALREMKGIIKTPGAPGKKKRSQKTDSAITCTEKLTHLNMCCSCRVMTF